MYRTALRTSRLASIRTPALRRGFAEKPASTKASQQLNEAASKAGQNKDSSPEDPSVISSGGAVGKQFNPDGNIGQVGEKIGGPFSKDGAIGSQFDASKEGIAGKVEQAVDGPSKPAKK